MSRANARTPGVAAGGAAPAIGVYNVQSYGAKGDGVTDDTAVINAAVTAAYNAGVANGSNYAEIYFPPAVYNLASATTKTTTNKGNAQIWLPVHPVTSTKFVLVIRSTAAATALPHWQQTSTQRAGAVIRCTLTGQAVDGTFGPPSVIGGPTPAQGYGVGSGLFNNMMVVVDGVSVMVPSNPTIMGLDFSGCAEVVVKSASVNASTVPGTAEPTACTSSWAVGIYTPQTRNNDKCLVQDFSVEGMYVGAVLSEHAVVANIQAIYCVVGIDCLTGADTIYIGYASVEVCQIPLQAEQVGNATAAKVQISVLDVEWESGGNFPMTNVISDPGNLLLGEINVQVLNNSGAADGHSIDPVVSGAANVRIVNLGRRPGNVTAPSVPASTVVQANTFWRDAAVTVSGGTVTAIKVDTVATGITSGTVIVPSGRGISVTYSAAPTWVWTLL